MPQISPIISYLKDKRSRQWGMLSGLGVLKLGSKKRLKLELVDTGLNLIGRFQINYLSMLKVVNWVSGSPQEFRELPLQNLRVKLGKIRERMKIKSIDGQALNHAPDLICYLDPKGYFTWANTTLLRELGYESSELIGKSFEEFVHPEELELAKNRFASLFATQQSNPSELRIRKKDGNYIWGWIVGRVLKEREKKVGVALIIRDVTERREKEIEKIINHRLDTLRMIWGGINHEINNGVMPIQAIIEIFKRQMEKEKVDPQVARNYLEKIIASSERLEKMTGRLHYLASYSGQAKVRTDLVALVDTALDLMQERFNRADIRIIKHYPKIWNAQLEREEPQLILMDLHFNGLQTMLFDLFNNAVDAIVTRPEWDLRPKEIKILVDLNECSQGKEAVIAIRDTGKGMGKEEREKIFTPFFTTKPSGEGTGLGMTLAHYVVKEHGGRIKVDSAPNKGTTVMIFLPLNQTPPTPALGIGH
ncbi:MAG: two-component system sensor histidine kinase NtrB [Candidatus Margulisiibacteriota bacterium]